MSRAVSARAARPASKGRPAPGKGYFQRTELPLVSLVFLTPLLVIYEAGTRYFSSEIVAFTWMQGFFHLVGATGRHLPALAVVSILLACHIVRHDPWEVRPSYLLGMVLESVLLALPLMLLGMVAAHYLPMLAVNHRLASLIFLSIGAGIYEELVFRLVAFTLLSILFIDLIGLKKSWANLLMVLVSSLAFSLYHYWGYEQFAWRSFAFRTVAGVYFGAVYAYRGFGISAGSHAAYDVIISLLRA